MLNTPLERMTDAELERKLLIAEALVLRNENPRNEPVLENLFRNLKAEHRRRKISQSIGER